MEGGQLLRFLGHLLNNTELKLLINKQKKSQRDLFSLVQTPKVLNLNLSFNFVFIIINDFNFQPLIFKCFLFVKFMF